MVQARLVPDQAQAGVAVAAEVDGWVASRPGRPAVANAWRAAGQCRTSVVFHVRRQSVPPAAR